MMSGLWLEAAASAEGSPLLRLMAGIGCSVRCSTSRQSGARRRAATPAARGAPGARLSRCAGARHGLCRMRCRLCWGSAPPARCASCVANRPRRRTPALAAVFYRVDKENVDTTIEANLVVTGKSTPRLELATPVKGGAGAWRAAVCNLEGLQVGYIEIET
jgi:hypothetical protein